MNNKVYELDELGRVIDIDFTVGEDFFETGFQDIIQFIAHTFHAYIALNAFQLNAIEFVLEFIEYSLDLVYG